MRACGHGALKDGTWGRLASVSLKMVLDERRFEHLNKAEGGDTVRGGQVFLLSYAPSNSKLLGTEVFLLTSNLCGHFVNLAHPAMLNPNCLLARES